MQQLITSVDVKPQSPKLLLSIASTAEEVREVQRLRYKVFVEAMGLSALVNKDRLDCDEFDAFCDHLIVRDAKSLKVIGTYRLLSPSAASRIGCFYSEFEFDLSRLQHMRDRMVEAGRACIHPDYRGGTVLMLLWSGLAEYMRRQRCEYLIGCASISLADGGHNVAAVYDALSKTSLSPPETRVTPYLPFPIHELKPEAKPNIPPLIKGYLRSGAQVCGEPAWDPDFQSADLFMLLSLANLDSRYAKHYAIDGGGK